MSERARDSAEPDEEQDKPPAARASRSEPLVHLDETLDVDRVFTARETRLVARVRRFCEGRGEAEARDVRATLERGFRSLGAMALALESYPSLDERDMLGGRERSRETLTKTLLDGGEHGLEWHLPTKAVLARTYGIAKVNFWTALLYVLPDVLPDVDDKEVAGLRRSVREAIEEAVYTRLAEELYGSFVTSRATPPHIRKAAIEHIIDVWQGRVRFATYRFCPILRSAWAARTRAPRIFGTLMGTSEIVQLLFQDCDRRFVEVFAAKDADVPMLQAFEEFLFDLPFESLERVRARMSEEGKTCVGPTEVAGYLGFKRLRPRLGDPKALYSSYRRRRVKAQYRASMQAPGPKRTAEAYVLEALLQDEIDREERARAKRAKADAPNDAKDAKPAEKRNEKRNEKRKKRRARPKRRAPRP